ncbi:MAG: hypothetical protein V1736_06155, partial [Pseudomonadota bacterium]
MQKRKTYFLFLFILLLLPNASLAWESAWWFVGDSHGPMAKDALSVLDAEQYPDLVRFKSQLIKGARSEKPHGGDEYNGGDVEKWWKDAGYVLDSYNTFDFSKAYFQIGEICHLTQDQAVPAHVANILHGIKDGWNAHDDEFESWAAFHHVSHPSNGYASDRPHPFDYYQPLQNYTRSLLSFWTKPSTGEQYWIPAPVAPKDATVPGAPWGKYGGSFQGGVFDDIYTDGGFTPDDNHVPVTTESPEIPAPQIFM